MSSPATQPLLQPVLEIENLTVSYRVGRRWLPALRDFHLSIRQGEIHGLVGESGSGKSTVASAIMRDLPPNGRISPESSIRFMGEALTQKSRRQMLPIWASRLKLVPQNPGAALNPAIRVGEQVAEVGRRALGLNASDARRRAIEMLQRVRLSDPENVYTRYPHQLSGGMQQRVLIAMALLPAPQLLVLDEPTTGLDVTTEAVMLELIRELMADTDAGALYVTHDLGVVAQLCDAVTVLYAGEIMAEGGVEAMFRQPLHPYTIGLLNSIPRPGQTKYNSRLQAIEGHPPSLRELPSGCVYAPRCPAAIPICQQKPPLEALPGQRLVRCHRWQEIAAGSLRLDQPDTASGDLIPSPPPDRDYVLQVRQLLKHFPVPRSIPDLLRGRKPPPVRAVDGVNLKIQQGHTLGLVGESGSGKTTLSRVIMGLQEASGGEIYLLGESVARRVQQRSPEILARLQMIFQNPQNSLNPYLTVGQAIRRPLMKLRGMSRSAADAEVQRLLQAVSLRAEYISRYPSELSGGEKQRVVIARAFASRPELIIADEPISALDVSVQAAVLNLLARLQSAQDTAYLFISHDLSVVAYLSDYIAVMYLGQIVEVGLAEDLFHAPLHPYTEALVSAIPIPDPARQQPPVRLHDDIPSARQLPSGCRFHTRCPHKLGAICETEAPPWRDDGAGHFIRCHIPLDELETLQAASLQPWTEANTHESD